MKLQHTIPTAAHSPVLSSQPRRTGPLVASSRIAPHLAAGKTASAEARQRRLWATASSLLIMGLFAAHTLVHVAMGPALAYGEAPAETRQAKANAKVSLVLQQSPASESPAEGPIHWSPSPQGDQVLALAEAASHAPAMAEAVFAGGEE
jgi:hypothetical protein